MCPERHLLTVKLNLTQSQTSSSVKKVCFDLIHSVELVKISNSDADACT